MVSGLLDASHENQEPEALLSHSLAVFEKPITSCIATDLFLPGLVEGSIPLAPVPVIIIAILTLSRSLFHSVYGSQKCTMFLRSLEASTESPKIRS